MWGVMVRNYVLALDQGTTSSRAILFDRAGRPVSVAQREFGQFFPESGRVEHDPEEIWESQAAVAVEALAKTRIDPAEIAAIGLTNQRETTVVWERATGRAIAPAIVWQDRRTSDHCERLRSAGFAGLIAERTGLVVDPYFSATKLAWILDNVPDARRRAEAGELCFGTVDSWLLWKLTGGRIHATDVSNASRTMLFDIRRLEWDDDLLGIFGVPRSVLPEIRPSSGDFGSAEALFPGLSIPIAGVAGDQQAALFGQQCTAAGDVKNTYGTGCFMLLNTGPEPVRSESGLLTTVAWQIGNETAYALEGSVFVGGAVVQWLRDGLGVITGSSEIEELAGQVSDSGGVCFVPAFAGLGTPYWDAEARGTIVGLTRGTTAAHLARAALESIAFQSMDVLRAMEREAGLPITAIRVDGGATVNDRLMQFQADILGAEVVRPAVTETTALGAAYLAGLAVGFWDGIEELSVHQRGGRRFVPLISDDERGALVRSWERAIATVGFWSAAKPAADKPE